MNKSSFVLLSTLTAAILCTFLLFSPQKKPTIKPKQAAIRVETALVTEKIFSDQFETVGTLSSLDHIEISSELSGYSATIYFRPGTWVKKGTLLIELNNTILKSDVASARTNLTYSEASYKRITELAKRHLSSEQALDQALADLQKKQNTLQAQEAQLQKLSLHAPFSGLLGSKKISVGQYVNIGQPLVSLIANQQLRVEYNLPEKLLSRLKIGQKVRVFSEAFPETSYQGVINYIAPAIDKETRTIAVEALIDNSRRKLFTGLFVNVKHQLGEPRSRLLVPEESLIPTIKGQKIFVLQGDRATTKYIKIGAHHNAMIEIKKGVQPHDIIIVRGQHKLKEGSKVIAINKG